MEGQELEGDDAEDALQTVHSLWQLNGLVGILTNFRVILATEDDWPALMEVDTRATLSGCFSSSSAFQSMNPSPGEMFPCRQVSHVLLLLFFSHRSGCDLLQSVLALAVAGVPHDDHDYRHLFVYKCQGAVFQLTSQDAL